MAKEKSTPEPLMDKQLKLLVWEARILQSQVKGLDLMDCIYVLWKIAKLINDA